MLSHRDIHISDYIELGCRRINAPRNSSPVARPESQIDEFDSPGRRQINALSQTSLSDWEGGPRERGELRLSL